MESLLTQVTPVLRSSGGLACPDFAGGMVWCYLVIWCNLASNSCIQKHEQGTPTGHTHRTNLVDQPLDIKKCPINQDMIEQRKD